MIQLFMYLLAFSLLSISFFKSKEKSKKALLIACKSFKNILPSTLSILTFVGITLALLDKQLIAELIGKQSGGLGILLSLALGSITIMPSFVAFPLGNALLEAGAGYSQVAAIVSTAMAIGFVTLPTEIRYFNKSVAWKRNLLALIMCVIFSLVIGVVLE